MLLVKQTRQTNKVQKDKFPSLSLTVKKPYKWPFFLLMSDSVSVLEGKLWAPRPLIDKVFPFLF